MMIEGGVPRVRRKHQRLTANGPIESGADAEVRGKFRALFAAPLPDRVLTLDGQVANPPGRQTLIEPVRFRSDR
jgi:hypothetical protein